MKRYLSAAVVAAAIALLGTLPAHAQQSEDNPDLNRCIAATQAADYPTMAVACQAESERALIDSASVRKGSRLYWTMRLVGGQALAMAAEGNRHFDAETAQAQFDQAGAILRDVVNHAPADVASAAREQLQHIVVTVEGQ